MKKGLVSVIIVNWNGETFLRRCIESMLRSDYPNIEFIIVDNASTDRSVHIIDKYSDRIRLIRNTNNGYAGGANLGISLSDGEFVVISNPDIVVSSDFFSILVSALNADPIKASVTGKLLKYDFTNDRPLSIIDSTGISMNHSRHAYDIGQNSTDCGQFNNDRRVFATCGAMSMYRRTALESIKTDNDYFDSDLFAYKEDVDLGWRLNLQGYQNWYIHSAVAWHGRKLNSAHGIIPTIKEKRNNSPFLNGLSLRNTFLIIWKNDHCANLRKDRLHIIIRLLMYIGLYIIAQPRTLRYLREAFSRRDEFRAKNKSIMASAKISESDMYRLFDL